MKTGNINFLETSGPLRACNGTDLPFLTPQLYVENYTVFCKCHLDHSIESVQPWRFAVCLLHRHFFNGEMYLTVCMISGFCSKVDENCTLLCYYTVSSGNFLPTFQETSARYYHLLLYSHPEEFSCLLIWTFAQPEVIRLPLVDWL
jgi:hypothetical protein